jgi:signal transduction histidine kinase
LKVVGLRQSIIDICENMKHLNGIATFADVQELAIEKLTPEQQLVIFRIVQEQSTNIMKYAEAKAVSVSLTDNNGQCLLVISDNGVGFDKEKEKVNGIGFINIFNRVDAYNGKVEITTAPGKGCTLTITMPYSS